MQNFKNMINLSEKGFKPELRKNEMLNELNIIYVQDKEFQKKSNIKAF